MTFQRKGLLFAALLLTMMMLAIGVRGQDRALSALETDLLARAQAGERIRVIVGFSAPDAPQGMADNAALEAAHLAQIDAMRDSLVASVTAVGDVEVKAASLDWFIPFVAMEVDAAGFAALLANPNVATIEEDVPDTLYLAQTIPIINADDMWTLGFTGAGYTVAVLDTGATATHPAFGGRVVQEACYSTNQDAVPPNIPASNSLCPNGNNSQTGSGASSPTPCLNAFGAIESCEHGTNVTGITAANNATIKGVATASNIISVNVFSDVNGIAQPASFPSDQVSGLNYVYSLRNTYRIAAVNMSLGGGQYFAACDGAQASRATAITNLRNAGIATIIATGNNGYTDSIGAPACISVSIAVSATTDADARASFANTLPSITSLFAPGVSVFSAFPPGYGSPSGYGSMSGTSQATPHVSGAFALIRQAVPGLTIDQYVNAFRSSGVNITVPIGSLGDTGTIPRINITAAHDYLIANNSGVIINAPMQGRPAAPNARLGLDVSISAKRISDGANLVNGSYPLDFNGRTALVVGFNGAFRIRVKGAHTLAETVDVTLTGTLQTITMPALREGDANGDNVINIADFSTLASSFGLSTGQGGFNANADFNGDGAVNISDFSLMAANFGQAGAPL